MERIAYWLENVQRSLFGFLEEELGPLTQKERQLVLVLERVAIERHTQSNHGLGRKPADRKALARAFVLKAFYNLATTSALVERLRTDRSLRCLCGWELRSQVPSESTFSRAFAWFAQSGLVDHVHESLVKELLGEQTLWHVARDSTAIKAREKPLKKEFKPAPKRKRGRPKRGEERLVASPTRLEKQWDWSIQECVAELPKACDVGTKTDSKGYVTHWIGYKFHVDVGDGGVPLSALITSASVHDSQGAIPLSKMTAARVSSFYDLMDSAYDAALIHQFSRQLGHVPIIEGNKRKGKELRLEPDRVRRYQERSQAERFYSDLKDNHGGMSVRVKGALKVQAHLMFGLLVIFAKAVFGWVSSG